MDEAKVDFLRSLHFSVKDDEIDEIKKFQNPQFWKNWRP